MIKLVCYADEKMTIAQERCVLSSLKHGVNSFWKYGPADLDWWFLVTNKEILENEKGAGFWLWKSWAVLKAILQCDDDDVLIYADSGVEFVTNVKEIIDRMDEDIFFFTNTHPQFHWCKAETMSEMGASLNGNGQVQASVIFFKVNQKTREFVKRWCLWCQMPGLIDDSKGPQCKEFQDHRHDQAILTNLAYRYGYKLHWWPTAYAEHIRVPGDSYPVMFNHHRKRNNEW